MVLKIQDNKISMDEEIKRQFEEQLRALGERFGITNLQLKNFGDAAKKGSDAFKKSLDELNKEIKKGRAGYADQLRALEQLNDAIEELADQAQDSVTKDKVVQLQKQRTALLEQAARQNAVEQLEYFGEELGKATITGTGKFVRGLQDGVSATQLTNTVLNAGIDVASAGAVGLGKTLTAVAPALAAFGPYGVLAATALGALAQTAGEAGGALAKFAVEILSKEVEKTVKAFGSVSAAGALFADGMTGVRLAARDARLPLEAFAAVISRQSATLAAAGLSVPMAVKKLGGALAAGGDGMRLKFQNLGFRIEEHGDLVAETMARMAQSAGPLRASDEEVAAQTQKYAENLRVIAAITGEDAKKKMAAVQEQANQLAFQQKLAGMDVTQRDNIINAMGNMTELQRKNFMDMMVFGSVINTEGAAAAALSSGLRDSTAEAVRSAQAGNLDAGKMLEINSQFSAQMQKDILAQTALGFAGAANIGGLAQALAEALGKSLIEVQKFTPEAIAEAKRLASLQGKTPDKMTDDLNLAAIAANKLAIAMETKLLPYMADFGKYSKQILEGFDSYLGGLGGKKSLPTSPSAMAMSNEDLKNQMSLTGVDVRTGQPLTSAQFQELKKSGTIPELKEGKALGGISTGPVSGYSETLHGTEAVVPLADNRSIPVSLDSSSITAAVNQQSGILSEILRAMQNNNSLTSQIVQNSY
jgi:hypothetical protein